MLRRHGKQRRTFVVQLAPRWPLSRQMANANTWLKLQIVRVPIFMHLQIKVYTKNSELLFVDNEDYWVYGTDSGTPGQFHWCSNGREFEPNEVVWDSEEPNSTYHCVCLKNMGVDQTVLATADCNIEKKFLCDVRKMETGGKAMQRECMEIWGITESQLFLLPSVTDNE
jgi:hypothetical protein